MSEKYWDEKFKLLTPMFHNNAVNGGEDTESIIYELKQIAADQRKACENGAVKYIDTCYKQNPNGVFLCPSGYDLFCAIHNEEICDD